MNIEMEEIAELNDRVTALEEKLVHIGSKLDEIDSKVERIDINRIDQYNEIKKAIDRLMKRLKRKIGGWQ